jgi:hypothetical protein
VNITSLVEAVLGIERNQRQLIGEAKERTKFSIHFFHFLPLKVTILQKESFCPAPGPTLVAQNCCFKSCTILSPLPSIFLGAEAADTDGSYSQPKHSEQPSKLGRQIIL